MSEQLKGFIDTITTQQLQVHSVRVLQHGQLLDEWHQDTDHRRVQHSVSKSFTCMAVGLAVREGLIHLDAKLGDYFPYDQAQYSSSQLPSPREITLRDLLRMSSGHDSPRSGQMNELPCRKKTGRNITCLYHLTESLERILHTAAVIHL